MNLVEQGVLKTIKVDGVEMPEPIHTFNGWRERGYSVKKGEKAVAKFSIWKHTAKKVEVDGEEEEKTKMFMKTAAFFKFEQVEKTKAQKGA